jgi:DNA-directed RNA polymerase subunit RPC12/RpoP
MLRALQAKVNARAESMKAAPTPRCDQCGKTMKYKGSVPVSWQTQFGWLKAYPRRYRCLTCGQELRPLLDDLGVEPGQIAGSLARLLALLGTVVPYEMAARLAGLFFSVQVNAMTVWRAVQRLGEAAAQYNDTLSEYHADSRSEAPCLADPPKVVLVGIDGCTLGMQVRPRRRRRSSPEQVLPPLPEVDEGHFREVKTGVLLLPAERVEPSAGRRSVVRRFLVTCLGDADEVFGHLWARLCELGWMGANTVVVIVGDGAEWIWNRATLFINRCEILDFWHAVEHAWKFARLQFGEGAAQACRWVHRIAQDLRAGKVVQVIERLKSLYPTTPQAREELDALIRYYSDNRHRMRYDEYLRLGYGIGSGCVESAHKQVVHARMRQAGMRWSELGARRLLALRLLLLNNQWEQLDRLTMIRLAA